MASACDIRLRTGSEAVNAFVAEPWPWKPPQGASRSALEPPKLPYRRSWRIPERVGRVQEVPRGRQRDPRSRPKASKRCPRSAQERLRDPKGRGRSAPGGLGLALLGRRRAAGLVFGGFAEVVVLRSKKLGFGGSGHARIVVRGTGQCRCRQFWGLASSVWGL